MLCIPLRSRFIPYNKLFISRFFIKYYLRLVHSLTVGSWCVLGFLLKITSTKLEEYWDPPTLPTLMQRWGNVPAQNPWLQVLHQTFPLLLQSAGIDFTTLHLYKGIRIPNGNKDHGVWLTTFTGAAQDALRTTERSQRGKSRQEKAHERFQKIVKDTDMTSSKERKVNSCCDGHCSARSMTWWTCCGKMVNKWCTCCGKMVNRWSRPSRIATFGKTHGCTTKTEKAE